MGDWIEKVQDTVRRLTEFFQESWQELKKVHWPSRKETYAATLVVIIVVVLISGYLAVVDWGFTKALKGCGDWPFGFPVLRNNGTSFTPFRDMSRRLRPLWRKESKRSVSKITLVRY